jgi:hypothetical protein
MSKTHNPIELSLEEVLEDYSPWISLTQCESYALTYLARHPNRLDSVGRGGWKLTGIQVWLRRLAKGSRNGTKADLIFVSGPSKNLDYLMVETEDSFAPNKVRKGMRQAKAYARLLEEHLNRKFPDHGQVYWRRARFCRVQVSNLNKLSGCLLGFVR